VYCASVQTGTVPVSKPVLCQCPNRYCASVTNRYCASVTNRYCASVTNRYCASVTNRYCASVQTGKSQFVLHIYSLVNALRSASLHACTVHACLHDCVNCVTAFFFQRYIVLLDMPIFRASFCVILRIAFRWTVSLLTLALSSRYT